MVSAPGGCGCSLRLCACCPHTGDTLPVNTKVFFGHRSPLLSLPVQSSHKELFLPPLPDAEWVWVAQHELQEQAGGCYAAGDCCPGKLLMGRIGPGMGESTRMTNPGDL